MCMHMCVCVCVGGMFGVVCLVCACGAADVALLVQADKCGHLLIAVGRVLFLGRMF